LVLANKSLKEVRALLIENSILTPDGKINQETALKLGWHLGPKTRSLAMTLSTGREEEAAQTARVQP